MDANRSNAAESFKLDQCGSASKDHIVQSNRPQYAASSFNESQMSKEYTFNANQGFHTGPDIFKLYSNMEDESICSSNYSFSYSLFDTSPNYGEKEPDDSRELELLDMMRKIEMEEQQMDQEIQTKKEDKEELRKIIAEQEKNFSELEIKRKEQRKKICLLELETSRYKEDDVDFSELETSDLYEPSILEGLVYDVEIEEAGLDLVDRMVRQEKKIVVYDLKTYAAESESMESKFGAGRILSNVMATRLALEKQLLELETEFGTIEDLEAQRKELEGEASDLAEDESQLRDEIHILETVVGERERILDRLNISQRVSTNKLNARVIRLKKQLEEAEKTRSISSTLKGNQNQNLKMNFPGTSQAMWNKGFPK